MRVIRLDARRDPRWRDLLGADGGSLFSSPPWLDSLADAYGFQPEAFALLADDGRAVAAVPVCRVADLLGERLVSLPFSDYCDPLLRSPADWRLLAEAVDALGLATTYRCLDERAAPLAGRLAVAGRKRWHGIDLTPDPDTLWARLAAPTRRALRKSERAGVVVHALADDERLLDEITRLQAGLRKRKYRLLAQPRSFFAALRRHFAPLGGWLPLVACHGERVVAVTLYLRWGDTLYYKFNASTDADLARRPNDALLWAGIALARRLGCRRLDLGVSDDDQPGLIRFKRQYGAVERELRVLRSLASLADDPHVTVLRARLHRMTRLFTDPAVPDPLCQLAGAVLYRLFA